MLQRIEVLSQTLSPDTGTTGLLDAVGDIAIFDVRHLTNIEVMVNQINDAGTVAIEIERSLDNTNWDPITQFTDASFPAGANKSQSVLLVDANGMPLLSRYVRVRVSAVAGGGTYTANVQGIRLEHGTKMIVDDGVYTTDADSDGLLEAVNDAVTFGVEGLTNIEVLIHQTTDPGVGTASLIVERTIDGTNWDLISTVADTDFAAANNVSFPVSFSGTGGRPMHAKQIRVRLAALSAGGAWDAQVVGIQLPSYR